MAEPHQPQQAAAANPEQTHHEPQAADNEPQPPPQTLITDQKWHDAYANMLFATMKRQLYLRVFELNVATLNQKAADVGKVYDQDKVHTRCSTIAQNAVTTAEPGALLPDVFDTDSLRLARARDTVTAIGVTVSNLGGDNGPGVCRFDPSGVVYVWHELLPALVREIVNFTPANDVATAAAAAAGDAKYEEVLTTLASEAFAALQSLLALAGADDADATLDNDDDDAGGDAHAGNVGVDVGDGGDADAAAIERADVAWRRKVRRLVGSITLARFPVITCLVIRSFLTSSGRFNHARSLSSHYLPCYSFVPYLVR
jgi:hypothetical protein